MLKRRSQKTTWSMLSAVCLHTISIASAEIIVTSTKSSGSTITVSSTDLGQTEYASSSSSSNDAVGSRHAELFSGITSTSNSGTADPGVVRMAPGDSVTVNLDISTNTEGYNITGIDTFFGWVAGSGGRSNQGYEITLGFVGGGSSSFVTKRNWEPNTPVTDYWTKVSFREAGGGVLFSDTVNLNGSGANADNSILASGVESITIGNVDAANSNGVVIAREIDIFGTPTQGFIDSLSASPQLVSPSNPITFSWEIAPSVNTASIDNGVGNILPNTTNGIGNLTLDPGPTTTTTYTLSVTNGGDIFTKEVTIVVDLNPIILLFEADQTAVSGGTPITLSWNIDNATTLTLNGANVTGLSNTTVTPTSSTTYELIATNNEGSSSATIGVQVITPGQPIISEFLASNNRGLLDEDGENSDWIELHNPSAIPASLAGYFLTDEQTNPTKWALPSVTLAPGEYLIVFTSSKNRSVAGTELHSNFGLNSGGEYLALIAPNGFTPITEFAPTYPDQRDDISFGFDTTNLDFRFFPSPSPEADAPSTGLIDFVADTSFSLDRGFYETPISVEITTNTLDAEIRYTTNGLRPTATTGQVYTNPITISETSLLRAAAFKTGYIETNVDTHSYLFPSDIITQSDMDTGITQDATYGPQMEDSLQAVPTISLAFLGNPEHDIEKEASIEFINFEDGHAQVDAGMERFGNRNTNFSKRSMRLNFRRLYGPGKIDFPVFDGHDYVTDPSEEIDALELRSGNHDMRQRGAYMSNRFADDSLLDMGNIAPHGRFVHVYINGAYWGQYHLRERWNASMLAEYFGGDKEEYEAINANDNFAADLTVYDGDGDQWAQAETTAAGPQPFTNAASHVDLPNIIDFMLLYATGNCESEYRAAGSPNQGVPFKFFMKDADGWLRDNNNDSRHQVTDDGPLDMRQVLSNENDPDFRILVADRIHKHYFNGGAFTPAQNITRLQDRVNEIQLSFFSESARWGERSPTSWQDYQDNLVNNLFPSLTADMIQRFKNADMYPDTVAPTFSQHGGSVPSGFQLGMSAPTGTIYYTLDGSDPRISAAPVAPANPPVTLLTESAAKTVFIPQTATDGFTDGSGNSWTDQNYNDSTWTNGTGGVGFETDSGYEAFFDINVEADMHDQSASCLIRIPFTVASGALNGMNSAALRVRFDDGFVAYLNGIEIDRDNFTGTPDGDSNASANHSDNDAIVLQKYDISEHLGLLTEGPNLLTIHGLNRNDGSSDFLISAELEVSEEDAGDSGEISPTAIAYTGTVPISSAVSVRARVFDGTAWSALNEAAFTQDIANLVVSEIMYHPIDSTPTEIAAGYDNKDDFEYLELLNTSFSTLDLTGVQFIAGVTFDFTGSAITSLAPGQRVLIVEDLDAFSFRYGTSRPIAGQYSGGLDNGGETLTYLDSLGETIRSFAYSDSAPWPSAADGTGAALVLLAPNTLPDHALSTSWAASNNIGGSPGQNDTPVESYAAWAAATGAGEPNDDSDNNGFADLIEFSFGTDPLSSESSPQLTSGISELTVSPTPDSYLIVTFTHLNTDPDLSVNAQESSDLDAWNFAVLQGRIYNPDGTATSTYRSANPVNNNSKRFIRAYFELSAP